MYRRTMSLYAVAVCAALALFLPAQSFAQAPGQGIGLAGPAQIQGCGSAGAHQCSTGAQPTISSGCGTGGAIAGTDVAGHILAGTATSQPCTITFATAWTQRPSCVVHSEGATISYTTTTTGISITSLADSVRIHWLCLGRAGG